MAVVNVRSGGGSQTAVPGDLIFMGGLQEKWPRVKLMCLVRLTV